MKRIFKTVASIAFVVLSGACQKELVESAIETPDNQGSVVITASRPKTKVTYDENGTSRNLEGSWVVDDVIYGFAEGGDKVSFNVTAVNPGTGVATLSQTTSVSLTEGLKIYAIYCPLKSANDIAGGELHVDFSAQAKSVIPMLLASEATVTSGTLSFSFRNLVSILGVVDMTINNASAGKNVKSMTISGHNLVSSGTVSVSGGQLVFNPDAPSNFITKDLTGIKTTAKDASTTTIAYPVYIVIPAGPIENVSINRQGNIFMYNVNQTAESGKYYCLKDKEFNLVTAPTASGVVAGGVNWAKWNLGASTVTGNTSYGEIFRWGDDGVISTRSTSTTFVMDGSHDSGYTNYTGEIYWNGSAYTKYTETDGKTVLDPVDDIVQLTYPSLGWRMPTIAEFTALDALAKDYDPSGNKGVRYTSGDNTVFFPSNMAVNNKNTTFNKYGRYWSSSIYTTTANAYKIASFFEATYSTSNKATTGTSWTGAQFRYYGFAIRPVLPTN